MVRSYGFYDCADQCICGRIYNKDEVESLRVVAGDRNRAGQIDESSSDAVRTKRIREGGRDVDPPDDNNERTQTRPKSNSEFHAALLLTTYQ